MLRTTSLDVTKIQISQHGIDFHSIREGSSARIANTVPPQIQISQQGIELNSIREETKLAGTTNVAVTQTQIS